MKRVTSMIALAALAGCVQQVSPTAPVESPMPSSPPSAETTNSPTPAASASAMASPSTSPSPAQPTFSLTEAVPFGNNPPTDPTGVFYEGGTGSVYVIDMENDTQAAPRYFMRKYRADGEFLSTAKLALEGSPSPTAIDAMAFQLKGSPVYSYRNGETFRLLKLATATVTAGDRYPVNDLPKVPLVALGNQGDVLFEAVLALDPNKTDRTGGALYFAHAEETKTPKTLFQIADPFFPTTKMAFEPGGSLILAGTVRGVGIGVKRLTTGQKLEDVKVAIPTLPDGMWIAPTGDIYMAWKGVATPALVRRFAPDGTPKGESEVRLKAGGFINDLRGMAFDAQGKIFITGAGFDTAGKSVKTVMTF